MNKRNAGNFADSVDEGQATHYAGNFFYKHLFDVWETQRESIIGMNDLSLDQYDRLKHMENWYDLLLLQSDMLTPKLDSDEEIEKLDKFKKEISEATGGAEIGILVEQPDKLQDVKKLLRELRAYLWVLQFKYGLMMPNKKEVNYGSSLA
jgi:hypothetical protein